VEERLTYPFASKNMHFGNGEQECYGGNSKYKLFHVVENTRRKRNEILKLQSSAN